MARRYTILAYGPGLVKRLAGGNQTESGFEAKVRHSPGQGEAPQGTREAEALGAGGRQVDRGVHHSVSELGVRRVGTTPNDAPAIPSRRNLRGVDRLAPAHIGPAAASRAGSRLPASWVQRRPCGSRQAGSPTQAWCNRLLHRIGDPPARVRHSLRVVAGPRRRADAEVRHGSGTPGGARAGRSRSVSCCPTRPQPPRHRRHPLPEEHGRCRRRTRRSCRGVPARDSDGPIRW